MHARTFIKGARTLAAAAILSIASVASAHADDITGAGATFPAPIYTRWGEAFAGQGGASLNYQGVGSGAGVTQITNRTVDFGASDAPVAADRLASANLVQFPAVTGAVVVIANIPDVNVSELRLTGAVVADIYLGRIRMWNDRRIRDLNPGVTLPALPIAPVYRAESSGTSFVFTTYLAAVSQTWRAGPGAATSVAWATGVGARGNDGVAGAVRNTRGGIGYVEYAYAAANRLATPRLQNRSGQFVAPTREAFAAAAAAANWDSAQNLAASMINTSGAANWPIVSATYILVPKNPTDPARARNVLAFFDWAFRNGAPAASELHYITLPENVQNRVREAWSQVRGPDGRAVWTAR